MQLCNVSSTLILWAADSHERVYVSVRMDDNLRTRRMTSTDSSMVTLFEVKLTISARAAASAAVASALFMKSCGSGVVNAMIPVIVFVRVTAAVVVTGLMLTVVIGNMAGVTAMDVVAAMVVVWLVRAVMVVLVATDVLVAKFRRIVTVTVSVLVVAFVDVAVTVVEGAEVTKLAIAAMPMVVVDVDFAEVTELVVVVMIAVVVVADVVTVTVTAVVVDLVLVVAGMPP